MTKHIPRKDRWDRYGPNEHRCDQGRVFYRTGQWRAELVYRVTDPATGHQGEPQTWEAGGFKRPRNAMLALEERATLLQRQHGDRLQFVVGW